MVKSLTMENKEEKTKNSLNTPKKGFVEKKKKQKFKEIPTGKVALINGSKAQNNKQNLQNQKNSPQKSPKANKSPQSNKNAKKDPKKKNAGKSEEEEEDDTDSNEEINEGVELESSLLEESDDDMSEEESDDEEDTKLPNILGASLADDTDEDDDDFEEEEEEETTEKKGVKMFKGVKKSADSSKDSSAMEDSDEDDDDDDEEEDDEEESDEEAEESALGLKALIGNSIAEDDEDDEDFVEAEGDDDDDDITSEEEDEEDEDEEQNSPTNPKKSKNGKGKKDNEDSSEHDVSLEELKEDKRTIFVGNLPTTVTRKHLTKLFKKFGAIDTMRLRGMVPKELGMSKKVAAITKNLHPKIKSVYAYIRFVNVESVKPALSMNDTEFEGNHLRVDSVDKAIKYDPKRSVFLGNLHFNIDDETVRKHFEQCGEIESVRVVRDPRTRVGKGFGYVNFKNADSVALALELDGTTLRKREIRVKPNLGEQAKKKEKDGKRQLSDSSSTDSPKKKSRTEGESGNVRNKKNALKRIAVKGQKQETSPQQNKAFQGQKADANKKKKNKVDKKKKALAEKLTAKPKKASN